MCLIDPQIYEKRYLEKENNRLRGTTSKEIAEYVISACLRAVDEFDEYGR